MIKDIWFWLHEVHNWFGIALTLLVISLVVYTFHLRDPRHQERALARRLEKQQVADKVLAALTDGELRPEVARKYTKLLAHKLGLPDLLPERKRFLYLPTGKIVNVAAPHAGRVKQLIRERLSAAGVNVTERMKGLRIRRQSVSPKDRIRAKAKPKVS